MPRMLEFVPHLVPLSQASKIAGILCCQWCLHVAKYSRQSYNVKLCRVERASYSHCVIYARVSVDYQTSPPILRHYGRPNLKIQPLPSAQSLRALALRKKIALYKRQIRSTDTYRDYSERFASGIRP